VPIHRTFLPIAAILCSTFLRADCEKDYRSNPNAGVLISDFTITGTRTLSSDVLGAMTRQLIGSCFNDDSDELGERVRALFQDRGYFAVEVKSIKIKPSDPLAVPKPAVLEGRGSRGNPLSSAGDQNQRESRFLSGKDSQAIFATQGGRIRT